MANTLTMTILNTPILPYGHDQSDFFVVKLHSMVISSFCNGIGQNFETL